MIPLTEYASVGYMAKRIQMRKNRFLTIQKMAEQKKNEALNASNANINNTDNLDLGPKQTVSIYSSVQKFRSNTDTGPRLYFVTSRSKVWKSGLCSLMVY